MKNIYAFYGTVLALPTVLVLTLVARPRPPIAPFPELELKGWRFDVLQYVTAEGMGAHIATNLWVAESWSGYALDMRAQGSLLLTPAVTGPHRTNFTQGSGTLRMWYSPTAWASASVGGTGPGAWATLFELAQTNTVEHPFALAVAIDPFGTNLVAVMNSETGAVTLVQTPIAWSTGQWHQIAFVYDTNTVELFVDDNNDAISFTVPTWPSSSVWNQSAFSLGSGFDGSLLSMGQLDEIHTFGYALSTNYLSWSYQLYSPIAALGPLPDLEGGGQMNGGEPVPCDPCPSGDTNDYPKYVGGWTTNAGLKFASNPAPYVIGGTNFVTVLDEASPFKAYQIFQATQILGSTLITTNLFWSLVTNGPMGVSNFTFRLPTTGMTNRVFYIAADAKDSDSDGFSDAYEYLVLHRTRTNSTTLTVMAWVRIDLSLSGICEQRTTLTPMAC